LVDPLKTTEHELENLRKRLAAEESAINSRVNSAGITLKSLEDKVNTTRGELSVLRSSVDQEIKARDQREAAEQARLHDIQRRQAEGRKYLASLTAEADTMQEVINARRTKIDSDFAEYTQSKQKQADIALESVQEQIKTARTELASLQADIRSARSDLAEIEKASNQEQDNLMAKISAIQPELNELEHTKDELKAQLAAVRQQLQETRVEHEQIASEINKARIEHENYLAYEAKSRKILEVKDQELQARAQQLNIDANTIKAQRSFLPPM
jgi:chromosome segregation ATPase